uniref:Soluble calcium-activated nucleotidase 1 n=1 Tax=Plectus sambesii TaxID=2011161 RepID=A0A914VAP0_9BILA
MSTASSSSSTDWRAAARKPPAHRLNGKGDDSCRILTRLGIGLSVVVVACFIAMLAGLPNDHECPPGAKDWPAYNSTPLSKPVELDDGSTVYTIAVVTDLDHESMSKDEKNAWLSFTKYGILTVNKARSKASVEWYEDKTLKLKSTISSGGRSMELSDFKVFDGHLISVDDRTGILYRIVDNSAVPWVILNDGPGLYGKAFKGEWLAAKNGLLYVGGLGKEWTTTEGVFVNHNPMWIKVVSHTGYIRHVNWVDNYKKLRSAAGITDPGYMIFESGQWSDIHGKWFFLPRRASNEIYSEAADESKGTNLMLIADEHFKHVEVRKVGKLTPPRGFSAFQFIPGTNDELIVALKSEEKDGVPVASYITVFTVHGKVLMEETPLKGQFKFEGIEFV